MVTEWNMKAATMLGYGKSETIGKNLVHNFIQAENRTSVAEVLSKALGGHEVANFELLLVSKHGERYTVLLNATTRRDAKGNITGVVGVGQDITELNQVLADSKLIADDLTRLIHTANAPIFGIDTFGKVTEWNAKASSLLGYSKEEAMGKSLVQCFITEEFKSSVKQVLAGALIGKETANFEFPMFTKDGERRNILLNATTRRGPNEEITGVIGVGQDITQIRDITSEHERVAADLSRLIDSANAPIFGVDLMGMVTEWNRKAAYLLGYSKEETMGKNLVQNFIQPENQDSVSAVLTKALSGQETANYELPLLSKHGERYTVLLNATTRRDGKGQITGVVGVGQDITELNQVMAESKNVADDLTQLIETANAPIFGIDTEGNISEWNKKTAEITGFPKAEALGTNLVNNFIQHDYKQSVREVLYKALEGEETSNYELPLFTKGGTERHILLNATARRSNGKVVGVVGVGQDITEIKEASRRVQRIADDLTRLIETANAPIFEVDTQGAVTEWNAKVTTVTGYSKSETLGKHLIKDFIHLDLRISVSEMLHKALAGAEVADFELPLFTKDGERRELLLNATPRKGEQGTIVGVLCVGQDITALNQQRTEAMRIAADLGRIIETANAPIFGVDVQGMVTEWNLMLAKLSKFSKEEALGKSLVHHFITEHYQDTVGHVLLKALRGEETSSFELPLVKHGEQQAIVLLNATARRGPSGEVIGVICVGQNITEINAMKEEQQRTAEDLSRLIDNANAPIFGIDLNGMVNEWNKKAADLLGYTKDETMGKHLVNNFIQLENRESVNQVLRKALSGVETHNYELPLVSKFGKRYTVLLNATTRRSANGQISGVVGVGQDITDLNQALAESKYIAEDLRRFIETANAPIFGIDTEGYVTEWNAKASSLLGYSKEEAMGKHLVQSFITEEFKDSVTDILNTALKGVDTANFEFPLFTKKGERREILLNATTRRGQHGEITGVTGVGQDITRIREITKDQERIADDLSRLIEYANAPIFGVDLQGMVTEWNRKAADILGYTKDETIGKHLVDNFIQPENRRSVGGVLQRALAGDDTANYELPLVSKTNKRLTVLLNATTRRDAKGHIIGVVGVGQDITELNKLMAEAQRVADDLTRFIETAHAPIFGISREGRVTEWNHMMSKITTYSKEEALDSILVEKFISSEYQRSVGRVLALALEGVETANFEFPLFTKKRDRKIQILMSATPRRGSDGKVVGMIGVGQDITQLKAETEKAETTAKDLSRIIDTANAPIFGVDKYLRVTEWNQMMSKISGVARSEALNQRFLDFLLKEEVHKDIEAVLGDALNGSETDNFELRFQRRETSGRESGEVVLLLSATARLDSSGNIAGVVSIGQDITEHKALEEKKMRFMAVVSHELRSPIHGICGLSESMGASETDPKRKKQLDMIQSCSMRLLDLVTHIMDVSSMRSKAVKLNKGPCNVTQILEETVHLLLHATDKRGKSVLKPEVKLINEVEEAQLPIIHADTYRITQVFNNLVMNALKFTLKGSIRVWGAVDKEKNIVRVNVEDTGVGIGGAHLERIFEPFEQEDDSEARSFEGIGLGLAISREVVRRHGGEISVTSQIGKGSTFAVVLPIQSIEDDADGDDEQDVDERPKTKLRQAQRQLQERHPQGIESVTTDFDLIPVEEQQQCFESVGSNHQKFDTMKTSELSLLIIDEQKVNRELLKAALRPFGCKAHTARSSEEAVELLETNLKQIDIVIADHELLKKGGFQFQRKLREDLKQTHWELPLMAISNQSAAEAAVEAFTSGATEFMTRPFDQDELRARLRACVQVRVEGNRKLQKLQVLNRVPASIASKVEQSDRTLAEQHQKVGVLTCRIFSFHSLAENMTTYQSVQLLSALTDAADELAEEHNIFRMSAEADAFSAVAGYDGSTKIVQRLVTFGLQLLFAASRLPIPDPNMQFGLGIGIQVGPAMAGVIGKKLPRYCFFGEVMSAAMTLQASGVPGVIHISDDVASGIKSCLQDLPHNPVVVNRGQINVGGRSMQTFLVCPEWQHSVAANPPPLPGASASASAGSSAALVEQRIQHLSSTTLPQKLSSKVAKPVALQVAHPSGSTILPTMESAGINILSTDDDEVNQEVIRGVFMQEGFDLQIAMDGRQCLAVLEKAEMNLIPMPSVLLLDSMMPGMSGIEVCRKLRERYGLIDLSIIMLTCRSSPEEISAAIMAGCNDYVTKPFKRDELLARVRMQLAIQRTCDSRTGQSGFSSGPVPSALTPPRGNNTAQNGFSSGPVASALTPVPASAPSSVQHVSFRMASESAQSEVIEEVLRSRNKKLKEEALVLKRTIREQEVKIMKLKIEAAGHRDDAKYSFETLISAEEKLAQEAAEKENLLDKLVIAGFTDDSLLSRCA
eukprot:TRINITY_DN933_c0_g2_i2.p1 TRINITY_DN933_c0_g2~~TRINITY_DN933_c0_g2_i2.p1  ORF type:complete len:2380 (-),score=509.92 TRINITY_DN933_c0_g2_i2:507-7646(-)